MTTPSDYNTVHPNEATEEEVMEIISGDVEDDLDVEEANEPIALIEKSENAKTKKRTVSNSRNESIDHSQSVFPLSRIKKIIKADRDVNLVSSEAVYFASIASVSFYGISFEISSGNVCCIFGLSIVAIM